MAPSQVSRWCFTHNNYEDEDVETWKGIPCKYLVFGFERASTGTRHLQGFIVLNRSKRSSFLLSRFPDGRKPYICPARGTNAQAAAYCKKDSDFFESGEVPPEERSRTDLRGYLEELFDYQKERGRPITDQECCRVNPELSLRYPRLGSVVRAQYEPPAVEEDLELKEWQAALESKLNADPDDRSVTFVVDPAGNNGKSWFQRYYYLKNSARVQLLQVSKSENIAHALDTSKTCFLFNVERGGMEYLSYNILERLKDKMVFSGKYNSEMKVWYSNVHVIVFCNEQPDYTKMTFDRYQTISDF